METFIYKNADIVTMDPSRPKAEACLVLGDRFIAVGSLDELRNMAPAGTTEIDLGGRTMIPGLIETHNHLSFYALTLFMADCSPFANRSLDDVKSAIHKQAQNTGPGGWIMGWGYDDTFGPEFRRLNRADLDEAALENPVMILHASGHLSYVNSLSLSMAGITRDTPQPDGGHIHMDESGEPSGLLLEPGAMTMVANLLPKQDHNLFKVALPEAMARYNQAGITSVHDAAVGMLGQGQVAYRAYRELEAEGRLGLRVYMTTMFDYYDELVKVGLGPGFGSDFLRIGSVKMYQDGSIQGYTGALRQDYFTVPGERGMLIMPQENLDALVERFHKEGFQIAVHGNGDGAIESIITAFERAQAKYPQPVLRHMIIHCQMATDDHIARMKALGIVPSYFPNHVFYWGDRHKAIFLGPERAARIDPLGSSVRAGLKFTLHADTPVTPISPLHSMHCAVNRLTRSGELLGPDERISPYDALKAFTIDAAYASFEEKIKGSITPGKLADFAVLDQNPLEVAPETIKGIQVLQTVVGGKTVYQAD